MGKVAAMIEFVLIVSLISKAAVTITTSLGSINFLLVLRFAMKNLAEGITHLSFILNKLFDLICWKYMMRLKAMIG